MNTLIRAVLLGACLVTAVLRAAPPYSTAISVRVDPNVELLALVFRLAGADEYNMPQSRSAYAADAAQWFAPWRDHPVVQFARELRSRRDVGFDGVMSFAVHLTPDLQPKIPFARAGGSLDASWTPEDATEFLRRLRAFRQESRFEEFLARHATLFSRAAAALAKPINARPYREWLDSYIGARAARFGVSVGLLNGSGNYGVAVRYPEGGEEILPILGAAEWDAEGVPVFGDNDGGLIVHEFCHSYTNPLVERFAAKLEPAGEKILPYRIKLMRRQAYPTVRPMLNEALVRAVTTRYAQLHESPEAARQALDSEVARGFLWTGELVQLLARYERQRDRYPALADFMPEIVIFFNQTAAHIDTMVARLPRAVSISPAPGATGVPAGEGEVRIEFDQPMRTTSRAILSGPGGFPPKRGEPRYEKGGQVFVYPVTFEAGKTYRFSLNSPYRAGFVSADGAWPMDPVEVSFTIGAAR